MPSPISPTSYSLQTDFQDLDRTDILTSCIAHLKHPKTANFVVQFGANQANVKFNLESTKWEDLLRAEVSSFESTDPNRPLTPTSHVEAGYTQNAMDAIAHHYGLSPRLRALMSTEPYAPPLAPAHTRPYVPFRDRFRRSEDARSLRQMTDPIRQDLEKQSNISDKLESSEPSDDLLDLNYYQLVDEVWHFASVDRGKKYLCLGYNSLHGASNREIDKLVKKEDKGRAVPNGKRVWSWLLLCDDGTVISIYEDPTSRRDLSHELSDDQTALLQICRRNIINVFSHLSKAKAASMATNALFILQLRSGLEFLDSGRPGKAEDFVAENGPSLLFYYLFEDWYSSYGLVARRQQQYGAKLSELRENMLQTADLDYINQLNHIGRQLAVLKRIYEGYKIIIDRMLEGQKIEAAAMAGTATLPATEQTLVQSTDSVQQLTTEMSARRPVPFPVPSLMPGSEPRAQFGPTLTLEATVRFERLRDRIKLYVLSEIQDCLDEKESMAMMNFNLIAMKESQAVEHLTRITILLAKLTIVFLPVSLMTGYFSTALTDVQFTNKTYWICFSVIMILSLILLIVFGMVSGTVESRIIYEPLTKRFLKASKRGLRMVRSGKSDEKSS
ncbi:MAG: hypothetical protein M1816_003737 [Peltula sp. TS41687]|nr:MAG: hypothetical protein M1816_003737 [Peltula sp. TS41687]